jgi:signal peptidase II
MVEINTIETVGYSTNQTRAAKTKTRAWVIFAIVAILSLAADHASKYWARNSLPVHPVGCAIPADIVAHKCGGTAVPVVDGFWEWRLAFNTGSAFSLFGGARSFLTIVGIAALLGILYMMKKSRVDQRIMHFALAMIAGGAIGNLADRIYFGVVTDFVLWRYKTKEWPVFNVADVVLVIGVALLFIDTRREGKLEKAAKSAKSA